MSQTSTPEYAYFQGQYVPIEEAMVNIKTSAFLYGLSLFEGIRGYWDEKTQTTYLFRAKEHFVRMLKNAPILYLDTTLDSDQLIEITTELVKLNNYQSDLYMQPRLYKSGLKIPPYLDNVETDYCCFMVPFGAYLDTEKGLRVRVSSWRRMSDNMIPPRGKISGAYVNSALAATEAHVDGYDDAIMLTAEGHVAEGSGMNFFMVRDGVLITTRPSDDILEGITRDSILRLAQERLNIPVEVRQIDRSELYIADEAFFCGTAAQVASIATIDNRPIGSGKIGPITRQIQTLYDDVVHGRVPEYSHWLTAISHAPAVAS